MPRPRLRETAHMRGAMPPLQVGGEAGRLQARFIRAVLRRFRPDGLMKLYTELAVSTTDLFLMLGEGRFLGALPAHQAQAIVSHALMRATGERIPITVPLNDNLFKGPSPRMDRESTWPASSRGPEDETRPDGMIHGDRRRLEFDERCRMTFAPLLGGLADRTRSLLGERATVDLGSIVGETFSDELWSLLGRYESGFRWVVNDTMQYVLLLHTAGLITRDRELLWRVGPLLRLIGRHVPIGLNDTHSICWFSTR